MNEYASLPWWARHAGAGAVVTLVALSNDAIPWWGDVLAFVITFVICVILQACVDGWRPSKW